MKGKGRYGTTRCSHNGGAAGRTENGDRPSRLTSNVSHPISQSDSVCVGQGEAARQPDWRRAGLEWHWASSSSSSSSFVLLVGRANRQKPPGDEQSRQRTRGEWAERQDRVS